MSAIITGFTGILPLHFPSRAQPTLMSIMGNSSVRLWNCELRKQERAICTEICARKTSGHCRDARIKEGDMGEIEGKLDDMHQMCMMYTRINGSPHDVAKTITQFAITWTAVPILYNTIQCDAMRSK